MKRILNSFKAPGFCILLLLVLGLAPQTRAADIYMDEYGFDPAYLEVMVGESVTWWNFDSWGDPHTTRSYSYPWSSGIVSFGYGVSLTVTRVGTFDYIDEMTGETGTLVVKDSTPPTPSVLVDPMRLLDGRFQCTVSNLVAGKDFVIETSTNLVNWSGIYTNSASSTMETYVDNSATAASHRFYRAWQSLP